MLNGQNPQPHEERKGYGYLSLSPPKHRRSPPFSSTLPSSPGKKFPPPAARHAAETTPGGTVDCPRSPKAAAPTPPLPPLPPLPRSHLCCPLLRPSLRTPRPLLLSLPLGLWRRLEEGLQDLRRGTTARLCVPVPPSRTLGVCRQREIKLWARAAGLRGGVGQIFRRLRDARCRVRGTGCRKRCK